MTVPISDPLVVDVGRRLSEDGHRYDARQLYYAVCTEIEEPPRPMGRGMVGCGVIVALASLLLIRIRSLPLLFPLVCGLGLAMAVVGGLTVRWDRQSRSRPRARLLPVSFDQFSEELAALLERQGDALPGLCTPADAGPRPRLRRESILVVCDRAETATLLRANAAKLPGVVALTESEAQGKLGKRRVVALHDADPRGCELPARLREAGAVEVVDAGLKPPAEDAGLAVIEGAPARLPRDLAADLDAAQLGWLRSGRRLELATLTPAEMVRLVQAACGGDAGTGA